MTRLILVFVDFAARGDVLADRKDDRANLDTGGIIPLGHSFMNK
jgi:hypothetical protein